MRNILKKVSSFVWRSVSAFWLFRFVKSLVTETQTLVLLIIIAVLASIQISTAYHSFNSMYEELNNKEEEKATEPGLEFKEIIDGLYTLTGTIQEGDCSRIVPDLPPQFVVILESPGGSLSEGSCLASHFKLRNVVTVIRDTPVFDEFGRNVYQPGLIAKKESGMQGKTICASACGLLFLGGNNRYLVGDVWFGIHSPATPPEFRNRIAPSQIESTTLRTANSLLQVLERLGVKDPEVRRLFIQIPNTTMYWFKPEHIQSKPGLLDIATHYKNFWGMTAMNPASLLE